MKKCITLCSMITVLNYYHSTFFLYKIELHEEVGYFGGCKKNFSLAGEGIEGFFGHGGFMEACQSQLMRVDINSHKVYSASLLPGFVAASSVYRLISELKQHEFTVNHHSSSEKNFFRTRTSKPALRKSNRIVIVQRSREKSLEILIICMVIHDFLIWNLFFT